MFQNGTVYLSAFSIIILFFILMDARNIKQRGMFDYRVLMCLIGSNLCLLVIEVLSWTFSGKPGTLNLLLNRTFNLLLYIIDPVMGLFWVFYTDYIIFHNKKRIKYLNYPLWGIFIINAVISIISLRTGWYFSISESNIYDRGILYSLHMAICYSYILYSFIYIILHKDKIEHKFYLNMILFTIIPTLGGLLQAFVYGLSLGWSSACLSVLIFYFNTQSKALRTDYLTGAYNRRHLDYYIDQKIQGSSKKKTFSAILIDIDNFKNTNDELGHDVGDDALKTTVSIIKKSINSNDFIARYGGDEFYIILDTDDYVSLDKTVDEIKKAVKELNASGSKPYKLSFSMGYGIYEYNSEESPEKFLRHIDMLMYKNKYKE